jgi:hypothetical protein
LVEQHQQCQRALGRRHPWVEIAARRGLMCTQKRLAETAVEIRILGEPHRRAGLSPELVHIRRGHGQRPGVAGLQVSAGVKFLFDKGFAACGHNGGVGKLIQR